MQRFQAKNSNSTYVCKETPGSNRLVCTSATPSTRNSSNAGRNSKVVRTAQRIDYAELNIDFDKLNALFGNVSPTNKARSNMKPYVKSSSSSSMGDCDEETIAFPDLLKDFCPDFSVAGKVAIVTGTARGQGRAIARALRDAGMIVIGSTRWAAGPYIKPAFIPLTNSTPQFDPVAAGDVDYLLTMDLADDTSMTNFSNTVHNMFSSGPLVGKELVVIVNQANPLSIGDIIGNQLNPTARTTMREMIKVGYDSQSQVTALLWDLLSTTERVRLLYTVSIDGYASIPRNEAFAVYSDVKHALHSYTKQLREKIVTLQEENPGDYVNWRVAALYPNLVGTTGAVIPPIDPFGKVGLITGDSPDPNVLFAGPFIPGTPYASDREMAGVIMSQLVQMDEPLLRIALSNKPQLFQFLQLWCPTGKIPQAQIINDWPTLQDFYEAFPSAFGFPMSTLLIGFPQYWDTVPKPISSLVLINPFMGPVDQSNMPITVAAFPFGDSGFDFEYKINNGPWQGSGTFTYGVPFPPLYTRFVNLSSYSGQVIKLTVRVKSHNSLPVSSMSSGNLIQTDLTRFFMHLIIE